MPATIYPESGETKQVSVVNPISGATVMMSGTHRSLYVNNNIILAALTIWLPSGVYPGEFVELCFLNPITALSVRNDTGGPVSQAPTNAYGPGAAIYMRYVDGPTGWVYWK